MFETLALVINRNITKILDFFVRLYTNLIAVVVWFCIKMDHKQHILVYSFRLLFLDQLILNVGW